MLDSLSLLVIAFVGMSVVSVIGVALLHLSKKDKLQKGLFYFLAVWALLVAYFGVRSTPLYMTGEIMITCAIGALSVVALLLQHCTKRENRFKIAKILVTISVIAGMIDCFMF